MRFVVDVQWHPQDPDWPSSTMIERILRNRLEHEYGFQDINVEKEEEDNG